MAVPLPLLFPLLLLLSLLFLSSSPSPSLTSAALIPGFRPPAIPLFTFSPALHAWSRSDSLTDASPTHWFIGQNSTLTGYLLIDSTPYRWLGLDTIAAPFTRSLAGQPHTDRAGTVLNTTTLPSNATAIDCAVLCTLQPACSAWTFSPYNATTGACRQPTATCTLLTSPSPSPPPPPTPSLCHTSGIPPVHWNSSFTDGDASTDRSGTDLRDFDAPATYTARQCAEACWATEGCGGFVFAHRGCDDRRDRTHCWIKGTPLPPQGRSSDCRQSGMGPAEAGWTAPGWGRAATPALKTVAVRVQPTQTVVDYTHPAVTLRVTFTQPSFPHDAFASSREHVYVTAEVRSNDGQPHKVRLYMDAASDLVVSQPSSPTDAVEWADVSASLRRSNAAAHGYSMRVSGAKPFAFNGDSTRPNWGTLYFATDSPRYVQSTAAAANVTRSAFLGQHPLPPFDTQQPRVSLGAAEDTPVMAMVLDLSVASANATSTGVLTLFYDEGETIDWWGTPLLPYWRHQYTDALTATLAALHDYAAIRARADAYDAALIASTTRYSGDKWATLLALAHRQVTGASTVVWNEEKATPWIFIKEMSTGGAMSTVDVLFPGAPLYLAIAPEALKLMLWPVLSWANNETVNKVTISWAPHDFGGYPIADTNAAAQEEMPLEESGNMILMLAGIAIRQQGDVNWLVPYRAVLQQWVDFINTTLPDPNDQLCTDDFEGDSPHNANLAVKGIVALNGWAVLLRCFGDYVRAAEYDRLAAVYARDWMRLALDADVEPLPHYKQRYDQNRSPHAALTAPSPRPPSPLPGPSRRLSVSHRSSLHLTDPCPFSCFVLSHISPPLPLCRSTWSDKYNLIFQYLLNTTAFPDSVRQVENAYYQTRANRYGIPLDNRHVFQKSDWFSWMGALAFDDRDGQQASIIGWLYEFADTSPDRQPFSDFYDTTTSTLPGGFIARFVMGGLWSIPILNAAAEGVWPAVDFLAGQEEGGGRVGGGKVSTGEEVGEVKGVKGGGVGEESGRSGEVGEEGKRVRRRWTWETESE